jgi:hypothetical protein
MMYSTATASAPTVLSVVRTCFVLSPGRGLDTIFDFEQGKDLIDVRDYGARSHSDLTVASTGGQSIDLDGRRGGRRGQRGHGLTIQTLSSSDFILA